jgi:hypothetical protein
MYFLFCFSFCSGKEDPKDKGPGLGVLFSLVHQSQNQSPKNFEDEVVVLGLSIYLASQQGTNFETYTLHEMAQMTVSAARHGVGNPWSQRHACTHAHTHNFEL